jgi:hypothetical protein
MISRPLANKHDPRRRWPLAGHGIDPPMMQLAQRAFLHLLRNGL